jgi:ATP adenylyltransferase/5',5'''-P-1,P-4-tetraphosphate phosphorylase II
MSVYELLYFNSAIAAEKPVSITNPQVKCPFCDRAGLVDILAEDGPILLVKNKYPVLEDTYPTVLVETTDCHQEFSEYPKNHLHKVIAFGINKWLELENSKQFASVIFYKSHGPFSGGTILHPHMQIIGLKNVNCYKYVLPEHFEGMTIDQEAGVEFNLATKPRTGFTEFNIILPLPENLSGDAFTDRINQLADYTQMAAHYILHYYHRNCTSYNIFFYHLDNKIMVKVIPRFITSPLFIGFSLPQVAKNHAEILATIREKYLCKKQ